MRQKIVITLALIYSIQFIISCCPNETYQNTVTGVSSRTLILDGINFVEVTNQDTINKEDLLLEVLLQGSQVLSSVFKDVKKIGFQSSYASIDCEDFTINYINRVESIEVIAIDVSDNSEVNVTNDVVAEGTQQSLTQYILENNPSVNDGLLVDFSNTNNLPSQAEFRIRVLLNDNTVVETTTNQVNFN